MKRMNRRDIEHACQAEYRLAKTQRKPKAARLMAKPTTEPCAVKEQVNLPIEHTVEGAAPIRIWTDSIEPHARKQLERIAGLPFIHPNGIAAMPDVHPGHGACVGSVLPMRGALVPSAVGLDAGCGMVAVKLDMKAAQLPDNLRHLRHAIEASIPVGTGGIHEEAADIATWSTLLPIYEDIARKHPQVFKRTAALQLGTLGAGNHFIEICVDEEQSVWVMIHSGSRGAGGMIGQHFIQLAQRRAREEGFTTTDLGLAWLPEGSLYFDDYVQALCWAQDYARENRKVMLSLTLRAMEKTLEKKVRVIGEAIQCHHNYAARERHFDEDMWITRKGAIRAGLGEWGIIPGSMGTQSFIVKGKGVASAYCSSSHGAGRKMSRKEARESFSTTDLKRQTSGIECRKDRAVIDEIPGAYKDIRQVMAQQSDLVEIVHTLRQVICVKGS